MKHKKIWILSWILILVTVFIVTIVNNRPYLLMGGSSSVAPLLEELMREYPDNHKNVDFNYISSASAGAPPRVANKEFGVGWLSKEYLNKNKNVLQFQLMNDGIVIVYNLNGALKNPSEKLNFKPDGSQLQDLYLKKKNWNDVFPGMLTKTVSVHPFTRPNGSGTRDAFDKLCLNGTTYYDASTVDSSTAMLNLDFGGIGYTSFGDFEQAKNKKVTGAKWDGQEPTTENIGGKYKLYRPFIGLINRNYPYSKDLANMLKWVFTDPKPLNIIKKYGPITKLAPDNENGQLYIWIKKVLNIPDNKLILGGTY